MAPNAKPTTLRIVLTLSNLGSIPEHQQTSPKLEKKIAAYFNDGVCDELLHKQIAHFGQAAVAGIVKAELTSWLQDLGTDPRIQSVTLSP